MKGAKRINFRKATSREWSRSFKLLALSVVIGGEAVNLYADYGISGETEVRATREFEARSGALNPPSPNSLPEKELAELPVVNGVVARAPAESSSSGAGTTLRDRLIAIPGVGSVVRDAAGISVTLESDRFFSVGTAEVSGESLEALRTVAGILKAALKLASLEIEGHTDDSPILKQKRFYKSNWELSAARASALLHVFEDSGIPKAGLKIAAYGDSRPLFPNRNRNGEAIPDNLSRNRRIVLRMTLDEEAGGGRD